MRFTSASCQAAFDASNTTLTLLGLDRQLPRGAFCSLADTLEAARHNRLEFLHLANPHTLCLVLQRHGPFGQLAQLGAIVRDVAALLAVTAGGEHDGGDVAVERCADELLVRVETLPLPPHVARTLEHLLERALPHLERADEGFKLLKVCAYFSQHGILKKSHVNMEQLFLMMHARLRTAGRHSSVRPTTRPHVGSPPRPALSRAARDQRPPPTSGARHLLQAPRESL